MFITYILPGILYTIISLAISFLLLFALRKTRVYQHIYSLSPASHKQKSKTPSFGGIAIFFNVFIGLILFRLFSLQHWWLFCVFGVFCVIGFVDDYLSILQAKNKGLSAFQKFSMQVLAAMFFVMTYHSIFSPLGWFWILFYIFMIVGASNATNLTDGLDGLLGGLAIITLIGFSLYYFQTGDWNSLQFCIIIMIAVFSFLVFNFHPAKIFMGDTGSLGLGALFAAMAIQLKNPWILIPFGIVYIVETLSVIIQVISFKTRAKRVFLMAPLHHHFELKGYTELQIVFLFWGTGISGVISFFLFSFLVF